MVHGPNFRSIESGRTGGVYDSNRIFGFSFPSSCNCKTLGCVLKSQYEHLDILTLHLHPQHPLGNTKMLVKKKKESFWKAAICSRENAAECWCHAAAGMQAVRAQCCSCPFTFARMGSSARGGRDARWVLTVLDQWTALTVLDQCQGLGLLGWSRTGAASCSAWFQMEMFWFSLLEKKKSWKIKILCCGSNSTAEFPAKWKFPVFVWL